MQHVNADARTPISRVVPWRAPTSVGTGDDMGRDPSHRSRAALTLSRQRRSRCLIVGLPGWLTASPAESHITTEKLTTLHDSLILVSDHINALSLETSCARQILRPPCQPDPPLPRSTRCQKLQGRCDCDADLGAVPSSHTQGVPKCLNRSRLPGSSFQLS